MHRLVVSPFEVILRANTVLHDLLCGLWLISNEAATIPNPAVVEGL